jgi:hypothetical protein
VVPHGLPNELPDKAISQTRVCGKGADRALAKWGPGGYEKRDPLTFLK